MRSFSKKVLIIGKKPPPIGGVTIHVKRLVEQLEKRNYNFCFISLEYSKVLKLLYEIGTHKKIHLHSSNVFVRFFCALFLSIMNKKLIITYHGNIGRYGLFKNYLDKSSIKFCALPIVLNKKSLAIAQRYNTNARLISAFLPPLADQDMKIKVREVINDFNAKFEYVFCTNAYNVSFDKNGKEIYGITPLVRIFNDYSNIALIISDPSGNYKKYLNDKNIHISDNVEILNFKHSFVNILQNVDGFIRATTTDGDSLSVKEALYFDKIVICSDCVDRPEGCLLYEAGNFDQLNKLLLNTCNGNYSNRSNHEDLYNMDELLEIYLD